MKYCGKCKEEKADAEFSWRKDRKSLAVWCKICHSAYRRDHYSKNKKKYVEKAKLLSKSQISNFHKLLLDILVRSSCVDCGFKDIRALEFDHLRDKKRNVSTMRTYSRETVLKEIAKCDIVCSNCHQIRSSIRRNDYKNKFVNGKVV